MGHRVGNICFDTVEQAADAYFAGTTPFITNTLYQGQYEKIGGVWHFRYINLSSKAVSYSYTASTPTFATCSADSVVADGISLGWLVGGSMVLAFLWVKIRGLLI